MVGYPGYRRSGGSGFLILIYLLFGLYFVNYAFVFVAIPSTVKIVLDRWVILVGGILLFIAMINQLRLNRYMRGYY